MKILAVVAARGGSKGLKDKNIKELAGKPLIVHTIEQVRQWGGYEKFIVSTDSEKIADIAVKAGVDIPFLRPAELATDTCGKLVVLRHALIEAEKHYQIKFDALIDLQVTSPIRTVQDIENAVRLFEDKRPDCVTSVVRSRINPYFGMIKVNEDGLVSLFMPESHSITRRQDAPKVYNENGAVYIYDREFLLDPTNVTNLSGTALAYEMDELSAVDIDTEIDFKFLDFLVKERYVDLSCTERIGVQHPQKIDPDDERTLQNCHELLKAKDYISGLKDLSDVDLQLEIDK
ncbi:MAG: acylneuraminate cytidylyltransferase family protein [Planctomycetota bacterium]|jgi:CMP-N-acetylneuraminic acid synthetase